MPAIPAPQDPLSQALARVDEKKYAEAETLFSGILRQTPDHVEALIGRGYTRQRQQRIEEAIEDYDQAIDQAPDNVKALGNRASAWFQLGQPNRCLMDCNRVIALAPDAPQAFLLRGTARQSVGRWAGACQDFEQALKLAPNDPVVLNQLSWQLSTCPEPAHRDGLLAINLAVRALEQQNSPAIGDSLAAAQAESGRFQQAVTTQKVVIRRSLGQVSDKAMATYNRRLAHYLPNARTWVTQA
ncbi:MAG: tetratricopeptide repeat protein [Desulfobacterales bacterium]|nr:tetratricopeptide repeat protein [Desulfobacterales bacterium]